MWSVVVKTRKRKRKRKRKSDEVCREHIIILVIVNGSCMHIYYSDRYEI